MTIKEAEDFLSTVTIGHGGFETWQLKFTLTPGFPEDISIGRHLLHIGAVVPDRNSGKTIPIFCRDYIFITPETTREHLYRALINQLLNLFRHELSECLLVKGHRIDPHITGCAVPFPT